jgi:hypothetical protein
MKHSADFWYGVRKLFDPVSRTAGNHNSAIIECRDFMEALVLIDVGTMAAGATLDGFIETLDDAGANPLPLKDADGTTVTLTQLLEGASPDPKNRVYRGRIDCKALPTGRTQIRINTTVAIGAIVFGASFIVTSQYEVPANNDVNPSPLNALLFNHTTKQALITP